VGAMLPLPELVAGKVSKRRKFRVVLVYLGVLVFIALVAIASLRETIPPFFMQGVGPTPLRQGVLGSALALFAISSFLFMERYSKLKVDFLYWYSLALALIAAGLSAVFLQKAVGSPIGWAGRSAQYLAGVYFFVAVLTVTRGARAKGTSLELTLADFFREAEKHYKALIDTVSDAIISVNDEGRVLLWNSAAEKIFGYNRGEAVGAFLNYLIVPDYYTDSLRKNFAEAEKNPLVGKTKEIEARRKDGEVFPAELSVSSRKTVNGRISTIIIRDISERKKTEEEKDRFLKTIEAAKEAICLISPDLIITYTNDATDELFGYRKRELVGKHISILNAGPTPELIIEKIADTMKRKSWWEGEIRNKRKDGTELTTYATISAHKDREGKILNFVSIQNDITERKKAEEALKYSEERYALAQRVANIGSWDWDIRTGNLEWSEKIEPMFGFGLGEFKATYEAFLECVHPEDRQHVIDSVNACIEKGKDYDIEHRIIWPDGTVRWVSETGNVIRDENNRAIRMLGVVKDITEHKQAEEVLKRDKETFERLVNERTQELLHAQAELDKAKRLSDIGTLAATVAHELRNPLGVIKTASYNIRRKRKSFLIDKHLDNIEKKISESNQIIDNLLSYSRIKIPTYEKIEIYELLNECISFMKKRVYNQNISIFKNYAPMKKKFIDGDPLQIREIFNNILTNAYQSISNKKGKIEVMTRDAGKNLFEINISDNGIGIDEEDLEKIFQPFFTRKSKGTGLGLTICNELVRLHGGKIDIKSKKGEGTTVTITLRVKR
jgi:PAS domain S-box-containing protein